ncbi:glycerol-3-phosphate acyltransferase [Paraliobacillus ryukyuensis]|uniref:Glycerol-3-phosphate acyltransferase n=1 Tax=Paraliobacillus ryukyuensis TaxID=200904 RepID=A0A366EIY7_9BACI|nr:glycerol-3-phosphate 1-O-acyltransferase PlsY [Paraliobacillus ryukyuensis]RBP01690.1 acyl-phosphate glycerol-3-phosphate acyltransferase [Paraliobacillus ryukyuensis]
MTYVLLAILAYLIGSIPSGLIVGKTFYNIDIREHGSGNLGGTNSFRVLGIKAGTVVTLADILKGTLAVLLPIIFSVDASVNALIIGVFAVIGHMYPVFARFKGGKAVATSGGMLLGLSPLLFGIILVSFFLVLYLSKYVSLASMVTGIVAVITSALLQNIGLIIVTTILTIFVIYRHRANIKRIINKTEPKIKWM